MLSIADLQRVPVYKAVPEKRATRRDGTPREPERLGKIHFAVFTPGGTRDEPLLAMLTPWDVLRDSSNME